MKKKITRYALIIIVAVMTWWIVYPFAVQLPSSTPEEIGLSWQECNQTSDFSAECFRETTPFLHNSESIEYGWKIDTLNYRLKIGQDTYETRLINDYSYAVFGLFRNGWPISILAGEFVAHSPNHGLLNIDNKVVWEFADGQKTSTIIYNGQDVRRIYGVEEAYYPHSLGGKLIFIGLKDGKYFVVYDGQKVMPEFDRVIIAYCCMGVMYSPERLGESYRFNGTRDGQNYSINITLLR